MTATAQPTTPSTSSAPAPFVSAGYGRYAITLLMLTVVLSFLDRQIINILAEPIKRDLGLADWQVGVMTGFAFAIFYATLGIPIAQLAERRNRSHIIAVALTLWSIFTALCGAAHSFAQLLLARIGVGIGEAGGTPPAHSLISDYFPRERRASALSFYQMGVPLGSLAGLALGGIIADAYGWRAAFIIAGAPGLLVALLVATTLREPRRNAPPRATSATPAQPNFAQVVRHLRTKHSYWWMSLGGAMKAFIGYGHAPFTAAYFLRVHGDQLTTLAEPFGLKAVGFLGLSMGLIGGICGAFGTWLGGQLADRAGRNDVRAYGTVPAVAALAALPFSMSVFLVDSVPLALALMVVPAVIGSFWFGPLHVTGQSVVPPHMRATSSAILLFVLNIVGLGLGPVFVGALSDLLSASGHGPQEGLRWALISSTLLAVPTAFFFWKARKTLQQDMES